MWRPILLREEEDFKTFVHQLCLHIAAMNPLFVKREDVPEETRKKEEAVFIEQAQREGKKPAVLGKVVESRMSKWVCRSVSDGSGFFEQFTK